MRFAQQGLALIESWSFQRTKVVGGGLVLSDSKNFAILEGLITFLLLSYASIISIPIWKKVSTSKFKAYGKSLMTYLFPPRKLKSSHTPFSKVFQSHSTFTTDSYNTLKIYTAIDSQTAEVSRKRVHLLKEVLRSTTHLSLGRYQLHKNTDTFLIS